MLPLRGGKVSRVLQVYCVCASYVNSVGGCRQRARSEAEARGYQKRYRSQKGSMAAGWCSMAFSCFARIRGMSGTLGRVREGRRGAHRPLHHPSSWLGARADGGAAWGKRASKARSRSARRASSVSRQVHWTSRPPMVRRTLTNAGASGRGAGFLLPFPMQALITEETNDK